MKQISIHLSKKYPIYIGQSLLHTSLFKEYCIQLNKKIVIITDHHLANTLENTIKHLFQTFGLSVELICFPSGEINKTRETKHMLEDELLSKHYGRDTCLIALGGGVVTDLVGFVAATYCRGIPVIYIPTTLLAMVDASIGGKTGVNTNHGKNLIGVINQPQAVFMDTDLLTTLPAHEWRNGIVELIKHSIIADPDLFYVLQKNSEKINNNPDFLIDIIHKSCLIKKSIVEQDEHESNIRHLLNFGHTIGHAIETIEHYQISHGEAVAIGMLVESYISMQYGFLEEIDFIAIQDILYKYKLPLQTSAFENQSVFKEILVHDKKSMKNIPHFVLIDKIGIPHSDTNKYAIPIDITHLDNALVWAKKYFKRI